MSNFGTRYFTEDQYFEMLNGATATPAGFGFIYIWKHRESGKGYVGKWERTIRLLCTRYAKEVSKDYVKNRAIINAMRHYGLSAFSLEVLHVGHSRKNLVEFEKHYIKLCRTKTVEHGYNCTSGGDGGDTFTYQTEEVKAERRAKQKGRVSYRWSEDQREYMRGLYKGRPIPQWQRDKIAATLRGRVLSDDRKKKQSETMKDMHLWNKVEFTEEQLAFIHKYIHKGKRALAKIFNHRFNTNYSDGPFYRIKKALKCQYIIPNFFQNQS